MIDLFTIVLTHVLLAVAAIRLLARDELDHEGGDVPVRPPRPWLKGGPGDA